MDKKGFTLIEVILAISLIGLLAVSFLPAITFGYKNTVDSRKFTNTLYEDQANIEKEIDRIRSSLVAYSDGEGEPIEDIENPPEEISRKINNKSISGYKISVSTDSSGEVNFFLPKKRVKKTPPVLKNAPKLVIKKNNVTNNPNPPVLDLLDTSYSFFVDKVDVKNDDDYLMSVYRWYMSYETDESMGVSEELENYFIVKEWNEAKAQLRFKEAKEFNFIPNIKETYQENPKIKELYNLLSFDLVKRTTYDVNDDEAITKFINTFGNRYLRYGVTPFSLAGYIGKEELSNLVYMKAPRIEIDYAEFVGDDEIHIYFKKEILINQSPRYKHTKEPIIDLKQIELHEDIQLISIPERDEITSKKLILKYQTEEGINELNNFDTSVPLEGNKLLRGSVADKDYGKISIWNGIEVEGEFVIQASD